MLNLHHMFISLLEELSEIAVVFVLIVTDINVANQTMLVYEPTLIKR